MSHYKDHSEHKKSHLNYKSGVSFPDLWSNWWVLKWTLLQLIMQNQCVSEIFMWFQSKWLSHSLKRDVIKVILLWIGFCYFHKHTVIFCLQKRYTLVLPPGSSFVSLLLIVLTFSAGYLTFNKLVDLETLIMQHGWFRPSSSKFNLVDQIQFFNIYLQF